MKALHIISYPKFAPHVIDASEAANPGENRYIVCDASGSMPYVSEHDVPCIRLRRGFALGPNERQYLDWCDALFVHPLNGETAVAVRAASADTAVVWCGMGGDFYSYAPDYRSELVLPLTQEARRTIERRRNIRSLGIAALVSRLRRPGSRLRAADPMLAAAPRVDFFCARETGLDLERVLPGFRAKQTENFGYYTLEKSLAAVDEPVEGPDILVGNSATLTNNHIDLFEKLRDLDLSGRKLVIPLSYGSKSWADEVECRAVRQFGRNSVIALRDWIPIADYNRMLSRCGTVFMNHTRGQAMGTISSMLFRGAKVYLHQKNPYRVLFNTLGVRFEDIPRGPFDETVFAPLTLAERRVNADRLREYWEWPAVVKRTQNLFSVVRQEVERRRAARAATVRPDYADSGEASVGRRGRNERR